MDVYILSRMESSGLAPIRLPISTISNFQLRQYMGLSAYLNPWDAGLMCLILVKTISMMKELLRSILGIRMATMSWEDTESETDSRGTPSKSYMEELRSRTPTIRYDSLSSIKQECSVCLVEFKPDAQINHLSCGHVFHKSCLDKWFNYWNITCPLCRNHLMSS